MLAHPMVIGEIALRGPRRRDGVLTLLGDLPSAAVASHAEVLGLIGDRRLHGRGLGYVDAHLLAAALLTGSNDLDA